MSPRSPLPATLRSNWSVRLVVVLERLTTPLTRQMYVSDTGRPLGSLAEAVAVSLVLVPAPFGSSDSDVTDGARLVIAVKLTVKKASSKLPAAPKAVPIAWTFSESLSVGAEESEAPSGLKVRKC